MYARCAAVERTHVRRRPASLCRRVFANAPRPQGGRGSSLLLTTGCLTARPDRSLIGRGPSVLAFVSCDLLRPRVQLDHLLQLSLRMRMRARCICSGGDLLEILERRTDRLHEAPQVRHQLIVSVEPPAHLAVIAEERDTEPGV